MATMPAELDLLLALIDQGFDNASWHGPNLRGAIRGVGAKVAALRPGKGRHNIWEQVLHAAYWKYIVHRRLTGEKRGSFALEGSNWFERPLSKDAGEDAWKRDIALLEQIHRALRTTIAAVPPASLHKPLPGARDRRITPARLITGIAMHDVYHAGQIGLIKRLVRGA
jgi:hypothetical protein